MFVNDQETLLKARKRLEVINDKFVANFIKETSERHVPEENEPLMDEFTNNFHTIYGNQVVGKSMKDIIKFVKESK